MKRRVLSLTLALVLLLCLIPVSALAVQTHTTSTACINIIKEFEGFSKYPYEDHGQWTVGYGTRCPDEDLERYQRDGITEAEAVQLLKDYVKSFENSVNNFAQKYDLELNQNQFDALVSFTYNVGSGWMSDTDGLVTRAVINQSTGNAFIFAMTMWCTASGEVYTSLINRRLVEANMYLNGAYSTAAPENYCYVTFDHTASTYNGESRTVRVQGYDAYLTTEVYPVGVKDGYRFLGWYSATAGGQWISNLDASTDTMKLYARWQSGDGTVTDGVIQGTPAEYERTVTETVNVYAEPSLDSAVVYTLEADTIVTIVADYVDAEAVKWGKLEDGCWIQLGSTGAELDPADEPDYNPIPDPDDDPEPEEVIATGVVQTSSGNLNIRSGAGSSYSVVGKLASGTRVEIYEIVTVDGTDWGRIDEGWICMDYVVLDDEDSTEPGEDPTEPSEPEEDVEPDAVIATGTVQTSSGNLNIRSGAGSSYSVVGKLASGARVEIYEIVTVDGTDWGRIEQGWICMDYVVLDVDLATPEILSCYSKAQTSVKVTWSLVDDAEGYELYRTTTPEDTSSWTLVKTITNGTSDRYTNQGLTKGVTYYYRVRAYATNASGHWLYSDYSDVGYMPAAVVMGNVYSNDTNRVRLNWDAIDGAHGYQIWRTTGDGEWTIVKTLGDKGNELTDNQGGTTAYSNTGLTGGETYTYKLRAFMIEGGRKVFGAYSDEITVAAMPEAPVVTGTSPKATRAQLSWDAVNGAAGYQVWMADSADGEYTIVKSVTDGATVYTKYDLTSGSTYFFKVRAYTELEGKKTFGAFSEAVSINVQ